MSTVAPSLDGIRVADFTQVGAGPYCTSLLGDLGADVIKVEPPGGEPFRYVDNLYGHGDSAYFFGINRSKRAIAVDLKSDEGREVIDRLLATCDVVITSMRPKALSALGLDYAAVARAHPQIVHCSITAFGESGPLADDPGMDILAQALGGVMGLTGEPDGKPMKVGPPVADFIVAFLAGFGICAALRARDRDGVGQSVTLNLLDGQVASLANFVTPYLKTQIPIRPVGGGHPQIVPYQVFPTADGWIVVACLTERFWPGVCRAIGQEALQDHPDYRTNPVRLRHRDELEDLMTKILMTDTTAKWLQRFRSEDVPVAPVNRLEDVINDPQVLHNEMLLEIEHPRYGTFRTVNNPIKMTRTPPAPSRYPPSVGEHTHEVLTSLGYPAAEIDQLAQAGVIELYPSTQRGQH